MNVLGILATQVNMHWRLFRRVRANVFWNALFPVLLLVLFNAIFADTTPTVVAVGVVDESPSTLSGQFVAELRRLHVLDVRVGEASALAEGFERGRLLAIISLPAGFARSAGGTMAVHVRYNAATPLVAEVVSGAVRIVAARVAPTTEPVTATLEAARPRVPTTYADFLLPGIVGMSLMSVSFFGIGANIATWRQFGQLRRLGVTPLGVSVFMAGLVISRYLIGLALGVMTLAVGKALYPVHIYGGIADVVVALSLGLVTFLAIGFGIGAVVRNAETASSAANVLYVVFMVLGGSFFPIKHLPLLIRLLVLATPSFHFLALLRGVINGGASVIDSPLALTVLAAWTALGTGLGVARFRWD